MRNIHTLFEDPIKLAKFYVTFPLASTQGSKMKTFPFLLNNIMFKEWWRLRHTGGHHRQSNFKMLLRLLPQCQLANILLICFLLSEAFEKGVKKRLKYTRVVDSISVFGRFGVDVRWKEQNKCDALSNEKGDEKRVLYVYCRLKERFRGVRCGRFVKIESKYDALSK